MIAAKWRLNYCTMGRKTSYKAYCLKEEGNVKQRKHEDILIKINADLEMRVNKKHLTEWIELKLKMMKF